MRSKYKVRVGDEFEVDYVETVPDDGPDGGGEEVDSEGQGTDSERAGSRSSPEGVLANYVKLQKTKSEDRDAKIRSFLSLAVIVAVSTALVVATVFGWKTGDFSGLQQVWNIGSVFVTYVVTYYFMDRYAGSRKVIGYKEEYSAGSD